MTEKPAAPTPAKPRKRLHVLAESFVKHPYAIALAFGLGLIGSAIPVYQFVFGDDEPLAVVEEKQAPLTTSLAVTFAALDPQVADYLVPLNAPIAEMPWDYGCTDEVRSWLQNHGAVRQRDLLLGVRSAAAGDTNMLAVTDIRLDGLDNAEPAEPSFLFSCPGGGAADYVAGTLDLTDGAVLEDIETGAPVALNLAPGEVVQLQVSFVGGAGAGGDLVADVASGADTETETLIELDDLDLPALGGAAALTVTLGGEPGRFTCENAERGEFVDCGPEEFATYAEAWR